MVNVFLFHGAYGNGEENWFPWLKEQLQSVGGVVYVPRFPTPEGQSLDNWMEVFKRFEKFVDSDTIFVGHSIGCAFVLDVLEKLKKRIRAAYLIAPFINDLPDPKNEVNHINCTFYKKKFDWHAIKNGCPEFHAIASDNDPYVPPKDAEKVSKALGVELTIIEGAGHFNKKAGYTQFPQLLDMIEDTLTTNKGD